MARGTKKENKKRNYDDCINQVNLRGFVTRIMADTDKVLKFGVDVGTETEKGNIAHAYLTVVSFDYDGELEEGSEVVVAGSIATRKYDNKYFTEIIAKKIIAQ